MNEKQRLESQQAKQQTSFQKQEKDYSQYFQTVYMPPSLKDARKRGREEIEYHKDFEIPDELREIGQGESFTSVRMDAK